MDLRHTQLNDEAKDQNIKWRKRVRVSDTWKSLSIDFSHIIYSLPFLDANYYLYPANSDIAFNLTCCLCAEVCVKKS